MRDREIVAFECDHMRPVVKTAAGWHHMLHDGRVGGLCVAGVYQVRGILQGDHALIDLVES